MLNEQEEKDKEDEEEEEMRTKRRRLDSSGQELGSGSEETPGETKRWLLTFDICPNCPNPLHPLPSCEHFKAAILTKQLDILTFTNDPPFV